MIPLPLDTRRALGLADDAKSAATVSSCESRSLLLDRYANPEPEEEERSDFFRSVGRRPAHTDHATSWLRFIQGGLGVPERGLLFAQLQSRHMVNMAGGVMENAGLCPDRFSGLPVIPGSAVKGCARRMAIQQLLETREVGKSAQELAGSLVEIALTFGWGETDWKAGRKPGKNGRKGELYADFEFACGEGESWRAVRDVAVGSLLKLLGVKHRGHPAEAWKDLPNFAGSASLLPAWPVKVSAENLPAGASPEPGKLELDVVTCHHGQYYKKDPAYAAAPDTEDPVPVVFPAVAAAHVFVFAVLPLRSCPSELSAKARTWLAEGLRLFGLGAKTAAGYGWFEDVTPQVVEAKAKAAANAAAEVSRAAEEELKEAARSQMAPEQRACDEFLAIARAGKQQEFAEKARSFAALDDTARKGFVLALRAEKDTAKRWKKNKPELIKPWLEFAATMNPPIPL